MNPNRMILTVMIITTLLTLTDCSKKSSPVLTVSILPQKQFVERIVGSQYRVNVMVGPGQNPHNYDPLPSQILALASSPLYFRIGVTFEDAWIKAIGETNPDMRIIDTRRGIKLRSFTSILNNHHDNEENKDEHHHAGGRDPHIWLSPELVKIQATTICEAVVSIDPDNADLYRDNLALFHNELDLLSSEISQTLSSLQTRQIMVFHPAWGYFTDQFDLEQLAVEFEGKEPAPRQLMGIINIAKEHDIKVIFVQKQFNKNSATAIAESIGGSVVAIDPLAEDYITNLKFIARTILQEVERQ